MRARATGQAKEIRVDSGGDRRLDAAVALGIISAEQASAIRALEPEQPTAPTPRAVGGGTLGYILGAITVLVAMGWFLADRWEWLGAGGVLAVSLLYALLFLVVATRLRQEGAAQASGFAVLLAVGMVPVGMVALLELLQVYPELPFSACGGPDFDFWTCRGEEITVELVTALAALLFLHRWRFALLALPLAALLLRGIFHFALFVADGPLAVHTIGWVWMIGSSLVTAIAYAVSRQQAGDEDFARWLHFAAAFSAATTTTLLLVQVEAYRHALIPGAFVAFAFSLRMRRVVWTLLGLGWFVAYLGWLASEVFRDTPFFPIVLAALGVGVIIATVWIQRHRDALVARFGRLDSEARPTFPGGLPLILAAALVAMLHLPASLELDRVQERERDAALRASRALSRRPAERRPGPIVVRPGRETRPLRQP